MVIAMLATGSFTDDQIAEAADTTKKSVQSIKCRKGGGNAWNTLKKSAESAQALLSKYGVEVESAETVTTLKLKNGKTATIKGNEFSIHDGEKEVFAGEYSEVDFIMNAK